MEELADPQLLAEDGVPLADIAGLLSLFGTSILRPETTDEEMLREMRASPALSQFADQLVRQAQANIAEADREQLQMAKEGQEQTRHHIDGLGELKATIHPRRMNELCGRYGPDWYRDPATLRDTLNRHPEMKAKSTSRHTMVRIDGLRDRPPEPSHVIRDRRCAAAAINLGANAGEGAQARASDAISVARKQPGSGHAVGGGRSEFIPDARKERP